MAGPDFNAKGADILKRLSDRAAALAKRLYKKPTFGLINWWALDFTALDELTGCGEPAAIPHIAPALIAGSPEEVFAAARSIAVLLSRIKPQDLLWLDELMRSSLLFRDGSDVAWRRVDPRELARWMGPGEPGALLIQLAACHPNGFVREAAIKRLALFADGSELPYLLLRLNDWILPVRQAAYVAVCDRIRPAYVDHFVRNLALVARLQRTERGDHSWLLAKISDLLTSSAARPAMITAMRHGSSEVRRTAFRFLTVSGEPDMLEQILPDALKVKDPIIRLWALRKAVSVLDREPLLTLAERLCSDRSVAVRKEALMVLATAFPEKVTERLMAALLDRSPSTRALARARLREPLDFAEFYRNAMFTDVSGRLAAAIAGLAETGAPADAERLLPHLLHPSGKVRRAAIGGLIKFGDQYVDQVLECVLDPAPGVSAQARKALQARADLVGGSALWSRFTESSLPHVRKNLLRLITRLSKWESIGFLMQAAGDTDETISALAIQCVGMWNARYNRRQTMPSKQQLLRLEAALAQWGSRLASVEAEQLQFALRTFQP